MKISNFSKISTNIFGSRVTGFIRDILFANYLGANLMSDAFLFAFRLPNLFRRISEIYFGKKIGVKYFSEKMSVIKSITVNRNNKLDKIIKGFQLAKISKSSYSSLNSLKNDLNNYNENDKWVKKFSEFLFEYGYIWADVYPRDPVWGINEKALLNTLFSEKMNKNKTEIKNNTFRQPDSKLKRIFLIVLTIVLLKPDGVRVIQVAK